MMASPKEQWRQQISDYDILFIKGGWLVDKSNRPLPFVNQENRGGRGICPPPSPTMTTRVKNTPWQIGLTALVKDCLENGVLPDELKLADASPVFK